MLQEGIRQLIVLQFHRILMPSANGYPQAKYDCSSAPVLSPLHPQPSIHCPCLVVLSVTRKEVTLVADSVEELQNLLLFVFSFLKKEVTQVLDGDEQPPMHCVQPFRLPLFLKDSTQAVHDVNRLRMEGAEHLFLSLQSALIPRLYRVVLSLAFVNSG